MRRFAFIGASLALALGVMLGGCNITTGGTTDPNGPSPITTGDVNAVIGQATTIAQTICGVIPSAQSVADLFLSGDPTYQSATAIASAVCSLFNNKSVRLRSVATAGPQYVGTIRTATGSNVRIFIDTSKKSVRRR